MRERVVGFAWVLAFGACEEPPRSDGPSPFGEAESATEPTGSTVTTSGDDTTGALPDDSSSFSDTGIDPATSLPGSEGDSTTAAIDPDSGSSTGVAGSSEGSSSSGFDTTNDGTLQVQVAVQTMWRAGECDDVTVTNVSDDVVVWEIELELPGTIDMAWNTTWSQIDGVGTFAGVDFNASLDPGAAAMFGFCVDY
jgi:endoglucanase